MSPCVPVPHVYLFPFLRNGYVFIFRDKGKVSLSKNEFFPPGEILMKCGLCVQAQKWIELR